MVNVKKYEKDYSNLEQKLIFPKTQIEEFLIKSEVPVNTLEIGKQYFVTDFDGHFCSYYLIERKDSTCLMFVPLWLNEDNVYESGEVKAESILGMYVALDKESAEAVQAKEISAVKFKDVNNITIDEYWWYSTDDAVHDESELAEKTCLFFSSRMTVDLV